MSLLRAIVSEPGYDFNKDLKLAVFALSTGIFITDSVINYWDGENGSENSEGNLINEYVSLESSMKNRLLRWATDDIYLDAAWKIHHPLSGEHPMIIAKRELAVMGVKIPSGSVLRDFHHSAVHAQGSYEKSRDALDKLSVHLSEEQIIIVEQIFEESVRVFFNE